LELDFSESFPADDDFCGIESFEKKKKKKNNRGASANKMASALIVYLRKLLRCTNYLLLFYGLAIVIISCEFYFEWISEEEETSSSNLVEETTEEEEKNRGTFSDVASKQPVFLYAFLAIGVYVTLVSWTGLWGVESPRNRCCLPFYAHNLLFMWVCSICACAIAFSETARDFVGKEHEQSSIKDITGTTKKMYDTVSENLFVVQIMSLVLVFVQTASLVLTAALRRAASEYSSSAFEESDDEDEGEAESLFFGKNNRNSANFRDVESANGNTGDEDDEDESWSERMKLKYGVDVSKYAHSPARPPPSHNKKKKYPGQSNPELAEKANFCGVM